MFQNRRQATLGNINLGILSAAPSYQDLSFLLEQAARYRGRFVEVSWNVVKTGATFQLTTKYLMNQSEPSWMLYRGMGGASELVWGHNSSDLTLMHNLVMLECEKQSDSSSSISAGAMDNLMSNNRAVGSVASAPGETAPVVTPNQGAGAPAAPVGAAPANGAIPVNPAATWLQNISQPAAAAPADSPDVVMDKLAGAAGTTGSGRTAAADSPVHAGGEPAELLLDGSLANITMPKLLRYLAHKKLTGRLALQSSIGAAEIFFRQGEMIHAATLDSKGENGLLDVATWGDGEFNFCTEEQTTQQTLQMDTKDMIMACERMLDLSKFLQQEKVRISSFLWPTGEVTRTQFEQKLSRAMACDVHQLWRVYGTINGNRCLSDLLRAYPMTRAEWIPAIYSLLNAELITIANKPMQTRPGMLLEGMPIDQKAIDTFIANVSDPVDHVLRYQAFLFLLQQEHFRFERSGSRYALALFSFASSNLLDGNVIPFDAEMMAEATRRIAVTKRKPDVLGHFEQSDYGLLLPETDSAGAAVFANRIADLLKKPALLSGDQVLVVSFGIASVPDDVRDLPALVSAAKAAKSRSKMMGAPMCVYGET